MMTLKAKLYAKFGNQINLDDEWSLIIISYKIKHSFFN